METDAPTSSAAPPSFSAPPTFASFWAAGVTFEAIMAHLQRMDACFDSLTDEMCQVNTCIGPIACQQARLGGFTPSPFPSLEASTNKDDDVGDDEDDDVFQ